MRRFKRGPEGAVAADGRQDREEVRALKLLGIGVAGFVGLIVALVAASWLLHSPEGSAARDQIPTPPAQPRAAAIPPPPPQPTIATAKSIPGDGTFLVGSDVQPGTYRSKGGSPCYWARLSDVSGAPDGILANNVGQGPAVVAIKKTDKAFESNGCARWELVVD